MLTISQVFFHWFLLILRVDRTYGGQGKNEDEEEIEDGRPGQRRRAASCWTGHLDGW